MAASKPSLSVSPVTPSTPTSGNAQTPKSAGQAATPGQKGSVVCEICDGSIKVNLPTATFAISVLMISLLKLTALPSGSIIVDRPNFYFSCLLQLQLLLIIESVTNTLKAFHVNYPYDILLLLPPILISY